MFVENLKKCLNLFDEVYVSSNDTAILWQAKDEGAIPILRSEELCGDTPNIPVYQHAVTCMKESPYGIICVQANSPTVEEEIIAKCKQALENAQEVMTSQQGKIYGSVWGMTKERLDTYGDPYKPNPDVFIEDDSIDIHTEEDYHKAIKHGKE